MKLYTINATCEQHKYTIQQNRANHKVYSSRVAEVLAQHKIDGFTIERVDVYHSVGGLPKSRRDKGEVIVRNYTNCVGLFL